MDIRAFGSYYGQSAALPYASGFVVASATSRNFGTSRGFCTLSQGSVQVEFSDSVNINNVICEYYQNIFYILPFFFIQNNILF